VIRTLLGVAGVGAASYGGWLLLGQDDLVGIGLWLAAGVVVHDVVLAGLVSGLCLLGARVLPWSWRGPAAAGLVVLGSVSLLAIPVIGRFGARPDNPTLLDRHYVEGWLLVAALTLLGVAAVVLAGRTERRRRGPRARG
jgi:hypothetical protein